MSILTLDDVEKSYGGERRLLRGVSLLIRPGDRIGLIGPNGCGKSTLLRILAGLETPDSGERVLQRGARVGYLEQEPRFEPELSVREVVHSGLEGRAEALGELERLHDELASQELDDEGMARVLRRQEQLTTRVEQLGGHDVEHRVEATLEGVGLGEPEASCGALSGGEARRLALARLLVARPDVLLLDEPTNHLDAFVIAWLEARLSELALPFVLVTHDRYLLENVVERIVDIDRGVLYESEGGYLRYLEQRAQRLSSEAEHERSRLRLLERETAWIVRSPMARTGKSKARIARYEELSAGERESLPAELELSFPPGPRLGARVVQLDKVSHGYGERQLLTDFDFELEAGTRLGVIGANGSGKSTLLRIMTGRMAPDRGSVSTGETVQLGWMEQGRGELDLEKTVVEEVAGSCDHVQAGERSMHVASFLERFLFPGPRKELLIRSLSGGERGRVQLAKLFLSNANVLVLDEPTNDLDLSTLRALEEALVAFPGAVVVVSHDRWFLDRVATHVLHLDGEGATRTHTGDASSLIARLAEERRAGAPKKPSSRAKPARERAREVSVKKSLAPWERREMDELYERVSAMEEELGSIDARLADPGLYTGGGELARRGHRRERRTHVPVPSGAG